MSVYTDLDRISKIKDNNIYLEYYDYVQKAATNELQTQNGILRPDIILYMIQILNLKLRGLCKGIIIYSNNLDLINLEFVRDVIIACLQIKRNDVTVDTLRSLFCLCIHRTYPGRSRVNNPPKTWTELYSIMMANKEACGITNTLSPNDIYFFDDRIPVHTIASELPNGHYFQVLPYERNVNNREAIIESDLFSFQSAIYEIGYASNSSMGGRRYNSTLKNRIRQKKQMRKHKYSKKQKGKRSKKSST